MSEPHQDTALKPRRSLRKLRNVGELAVTPRFRQHGPAMKALREKDGYSQGGLAEAVGITPQALQAIENETQNTSVLTLNKIARALGVPVVAVMNRHESA